MTGVSVCVGARDGSFCPVCGQDLPGRRGAGRYPNGQCPNRWCARTDRVFSVVFAAAPYNSSVRHGILRYKYGGERWRAEALGRLLARYLSEHSSCFEEFDVLTTMPSYRGPGARRDWDHVGELVREAESALGPGWSWTTGAVVKQAETPAMQSRHSAERRAIAEGPLRAALTVPDPGLIDGARVLVTDDVFTEGSTLREVALALRRAGAAEVAGLAVARQVWRGRAGGRP